MIRELACEKCGKTWRVEVPSLLNVKIQSCLDCGHFKFHHEPAIRHASPHNPPTSNQEISASLKTFGCLNN